MKNSVLVALLHGIGDGILATPAVRQFRKENQDTVIWLLVRGDISAADVWENNPNIDQVLCYTKSYPPYWHPLYHFWRRWLFEAELRSLGKVIGTKRTIHITTGALPTIFKRLLRYPAKQDIMARELGVTLTSRRTEVFPSAEHRALAEAFLQPNAHLPLIAVNRCGSAYSKYWNIDQYEAVCKALVARGHGVVQCYTPQSREIEIENDGRSAWSSPHSLPTDALGDSHLLVTAAILERCAAVVSVDSAIMHLAGAVERPVVGIFVREAWGPDTHQGLSATFIALRGQAPGDEVLSALARLDL